MLKFEKIDHNFMITVVYVLDHRQRLLIDLVLDLFIYFPILYSRSKL